VAQCSLLLTYYTTTSDYECSTAWLKKAIATARDAQAHLYTSLSDSDERKPVLKRLWWCCLLRDRIMSLGLRRRLQIPPEDLDSSIVGLEEADFQEEIQQPLIYNSTTKRALVQWLSLVCELAVVLDDILALTYDTRPQASNLQHICDIKEQIYRLEEWYNIAVAKVRGVTQWPGLHQSASTFINVMYIYYL
jgi:hypothetical protein